MDVVVGDADVLIALVHKKDPNHLKTIKISGNLIKKGTRIIFPNTAIMESITTLKRALNLPDEAHLLKRQYQQGFFEVEYVDEKIQQRASKIFEQAVSKKNTFFDAIVTATAEYLGTKTIFSFDSWYPKLGFKLTSG